MCLILFKVIHHVDQWVDDVVNGLVLSPNAMVHFVVNDAVEHSLASVASYDLVDSELQKKFPEEKNQS